MYSRIGVNKSKKLNSVLRDIKTPRSNRVNPNSVNTHYDVDDMEFYEDEFRNDYDKESDWNNECPLETCKMKINYKKWGLITVGAIVGVSAVAYCLKKK